MAGLQGRTAIVTGGSSGIGQAIAIRLGQEGVNVATNYVGPVDGAVATRDAIEGGVERCMHEALVRGRPAVGVVHRLVRSGAGPVRLELDVLGTWRDIHGERFAGDPVVEAVDGGFVFEGAWRTRGPGFEPAGGWYWGRGTGSKPTAGSTPSRTSGTVGVSRQTSQPARRTALRRGRPGSGRPISLRRPPAPTRGR